MAIETPEAELDIREQLIRGSLRLISNEGPVDLTVRRLALAGSRTTMCIYTKFSSRQGLLLAVYERAGQELLDRLDAASGGVAELAEEYRAAATDDSGLYALLFEQPLAGLDLDPVLRARLIGQVTSRIASALVRDGADTSAAPSTADALWATMHGLVALSLSQGSEPDRARFASIVLAVATPAVTPA